MIMVANADGSGLSPATPEPLDGLVAWSISPDGRDVLVTTEHLGQRLMTVLAVDGSREPRPLDVPLTVDPGEEASTYRPPDGREILVDRPADGLRDARDLRRRRSEWGAAPHDRCAVGGFGRVRGGLVADRRCRHLLRV